MVSFSYKTRTYGTGLTYPGGKTDLVLHKTICGLAGGYGSGIAFFFTHSALFAATTSGDRVGMTFMVKGFEIWAQPVSISAAAMMMVFIYSLRSKYS